MTRRARARAHQTVQRVRRWTRAYYPYVLGTIGALVGIGHGASTLDLHLTVAWACTLAWTVFCYLEAKHSAQIEEVWAERYFGTVIDLHRAGRTLYETGRRDGRREAAGGQHTSGHRARLDPEG